jgi:hypothetical protein
MILALAAKGKKITACIMLALIYLEMVVPAFALGSRTAGKGYAAKAYAPGITAPAVMPAHVNKPAVHISVKKPAANTAGEDLGGPTQPENQSFHPVGNDKMVDLFSGDFSYNIPLIDVGGYPLAIGYNSGITMDQEASWTGLGWNINPGTITRNMRGIPDDFNGSDSITKTVSVKENKTIGVTAGADVEIVGLPLGLGASIGVFHNSYRGWGLENSINASINAASGAAGSLTAGLSLTNNSQEGLTISPGLSYSIFAKNANDQGGFSGSISTGLSYNSRSGMKALQLSAGIRQYDEYSHTGEKVRDMIARSEGTPTWVGQSGSLSVFSSNISYAYPTYTPTITLPFTSRSYTVTLKAGTEMVVLHPSLFISGYVSKQWIAPEDKVMYMPAYGYLNYQNGARDPGALLDFNREKEMPYREKPEIPNIAVPSYTYDVFSMSGEGTGGTFRAYRGDIGYVYDHHMRTKDESGRLSVDLGFGNLFHGGADLNYTRAFTQSGAWLESNPLASTVKFTSPSKDYEAAYFRNPGEKTVNAGAFYNAIGGDEVVIPKLYQAGRNSAVITTTNYLTKYKEGKKLEDVQLTNANAIKTTRDKRTQVISHLTAAEASIGGLSRYIDNYGINKYVIQNCTNSFPDDMNKEGVGWKGEYYSGRDFQSLLFVKTDPGITFPDKAAFQNSQPAGTTPLNENYSVRWTGRIKAPVTGQYNISTETDDGIRLYINDSIFINDWRDQPSKANSTTVNLEAGQIYRIRVEYYNGPGFSRMMMQWKCGTTVVGVKDMYLPQAADTFEAVPGLVKENRINDFRKGSHISEINVLNADGKKYVYGIPVYNLRQKETSFSVRNDRGNAAEGTADYNPGSDNTINNTNGNDRYFTSEEIPAYAHSFLLTSVVSPDYADITGDGISDDDPGDAVKFNYTKTAGKTNPFKWRTPYSSKANYNEGLKTDTRDDKGSYVYGEKELWYLNSIASKNMIATFKVGDRSDLLPINENGEKDTSSHVAKKLEEINIYTKADFMKYNTAATPVKTVHFEYTYELCAGVNAPKNNAGKLTLKRIWFSYNGNKKGKRNAYVFNYNSNNPAYNTKSYDRWGNYKDPLQNPGSTSGNLITNAQYPYALQDSTIAATNAAAWTLDSIVLPSGGRMKINYEGDDYAYVQNRRAAQMFSIAGFSAGAPAGLNSLSNRLYEGADNLYVAIHVSQPVQSKEEVYRKYLEGMDQIYFRLHVKMPADKFGSGEEFVPCYGKLDNGNYGFINNGNTIWVKLKSIDTKGNEGGPYSPLAKTAIQFLRLNLPSKAYPGSDVGDNLDFGDGVKILFSMADNIRNAVRSYDATARAKGWAKEVDLSRSFVRLHSPAYKKYGGGLRVKNIVIYDHWNAMTGQKESKYGTEYTYTTLKKINGVETAISSGVATYEPILGGEENPWRLPIEYTDQVAPMAPTNMGYVEMPLGESFFPGASVGYSKVRTRSVKTKNTRSANGYEESTFYTSYDFPTITDHSLLDDNTKLRYKPRLSNFLRINAVHHLVMSQGFKVELNDMNGKIRTHAVYPETDKNNPIAYSENFYRVDNQLSEIKHLNNNVMSINAAGKIDSAAVIGKDVELMMDMRQQLSISNGNNANINVDLFLFFIPPVLGIPSFLVMPQREENLFRSVAATKVISRHGILDSIVVITKGSKVVTHNMLYDAETGDVLLTATQSEFKDSVYNFNYPAGWVYDGMSGAYKNINVIMDHIEMKEGKITGGISTSAVADYFSGGDEILVYTRNKVGGTDCTPLLATFPGTAKIWAIDANALNGGDPDLYFMDQKGAPFTGNDVLLKVIRSGRKNIAATVGSVSMLVNPLQKSGGEYQLNISKDSKILNATVTEYQQNWQVEDRKKQKISCAY